MKIKSLLTPILLFVNVISYAQKALPVRVGNYLNRVPVAESSAASFKMCTIDSNSEGVLSVKDAGPTINGIKDDLNKYMNDVMNSAMSNSYSNTSVPSQDQINQMMQNATQMKSMSPGQIRQMSQGAHHQTSASANTASIMKEVGAAENAAAQLSIIENELAAKAAKLAGEYQQKMKAVGNVKNTCVEYKVQGADLALPKCGCIEGVYLNYYEKRVSVEDQYLQKVKELAQSYLVKFKEQIAIIDKVENDLSYGDAVSIPVVKNRLGGLQRQAMGSLTPLLGIISHSIEDSAKEYVNVVNTNNGHLPTPCQ